MSLAPPVSSLPSQQDRYSSSGSFRDGGDSMQFPSSTPISLAPSFASVQSSTRPHTPQPVSSNNNDRMPLSVGFNQDHGCFSCGTQSGFRIYNSDPFTETTRRDFDGAGIAIVEMLFRSSIFALVGGGKTPRYSPNKVMIWDDHQGRCIGELSFRSQVRAVKLRRDRIVVVLEDKIYVYSLADLKLLHQIETFSNIKGICALSPASASCVLACPGQRKGEIRIELYSLKKTRFLQGHDSSLACMALCRNGALLATASTKGTLIRIFSTADGVKLQELRRGADRAAIYSISFSPSTQWLVLSSDKGTVHGFGLKPLLEEAQADVAGMSTSPTGTGTALPSAGSSGTSLISAGTNAGSSLSFMRGVLPKYFSSEWSFAQFHVPEETKAIVAFGPQKNTVIIVCANGSYYRCSYDPVHGGEMVQQEYERFMKHDGDDELVTG